MSTCRPPRFEGSVVLECGRQLGFAEYGSGGTTKTWSEPENNGDKIWIWEDDEWKGYYWLMDHVGDKWDGRWWDSSKNDFADFALEPGRAYYYFHKVNQWGGTNFNWRPPTP